MKKIKIFALVEGKIIDELSDRASGTFIRIHYILKHLKQHKDIKLIYIPFEYGQKYSDTYSRISWCIDTFYHFAIPFLSLLIIIFKRPHFIYFSYPNVVYNDKFNIPLLKFAKKIGIKLVMYSHDWVEQSKIQGQGKNPFISEDLERELVEISDILLVAFSKYPQKETIVLPGGLEESEFSHLKYKIVKNRFNIGYTGSLHPGKGIDTLVNAVVRLHRKYPYVRLYLWGSLQKELDDRTKDIIEKSKYITNEIVPRTQLFKNLPKIDVLAYTYNPSIDYWDKNHPTKFFEYIGSEIPFISTKCNGIKKITSGRGLLFVDYSAEDFCEKLEYLLNNPNERLRLHKELGELKKENTWAKRAEIFHDVILKDFNCHFDLNKN